MRLAASVCLLFSLLAAAGCGGSLPATVSGKVTLDGQPPPPNTRCSISFQPVSGERIANGNAQADGSYTLSSGDEQGIPPGDYIVVVIIGEIQDPAKLGAAAPLPPKQFAPAKYGRKETSDLKFTIKPGHNVVDLPLKS